MRWFSAVFLTVAGVLLAGCRGERVQSALHPEGPASRMIAEFWWFMCIVLAVIFVVMCVLIAWAVLRGRRHDGPPPRPGNTFIIVGGIALPAVVSLAVMIYSLVTTLALQAPPNPAMTIQVIGHQWWWEVRYPDHVMVTANELHIPVGVPIRLELESADVIHSFWVPQLHGKMDLLPNHPTTFWFQADRPGRFRGQCAEFCGAQHARMAFYVIAREPSEFNAWMQSMRQPHPEPQTALERRGREAFFQADCNACHAVRGTDAVARVGPDLTHFRDRHTIGAGQLSNTEDHLAAWIIDPHRFKPGNLMPPTHATAEDIEAMVAYLMAVAEPTDGDER